MSVVVGFDLSLTSSGVAVVDHQGCELVARVPSKGRAGDTLHSRSIRLNTLEQLLHRYLIQSDADLVVVEGPSFGQHRQSGTHDRAGLWWLVVTHALNVGLPVVEVPPATLKTYATGKGNAAKDQVLAAVVRRYPDVDVTGNDEADALVLAAIGARHLGQPIDDDLPKANLKALDKIRWP